MAEQSLPDGCIPVQVQHPPRFNILHLPTEGMVQHEVLVQVLADVLSPFAELATILVETSPSGSVLAHPGSLLQGMEQAAYQLGCHDLTALMPAEVVHRG